MSTVPSSALSKMPEGDLFNAFHEARRIQDTQQERLSAAKQLLKLLDADGAEDSFFMQTFRYVIDQADQLQETRRDVYRLGAELDRRGLL